MILARFTHDGGHFSPRYNEIVIDAQFMKANLPSSILGVFYQEGNTREQAAYIHNGFVTAFGLQPEQVPFMKFSSAQGFQLG